MPKRTPHTSCQGATRPVTIHERVKAHQPLVRAMARRYARLGLDREDLVQEGVLGLLEATERFDESRDNTFATYARHWVRYRMQRHVRRTRGMVPLPQTRAIRRVRRKLRSATAAIEARTGEVTTPAALAAELDVDVESVELVLTGMRHRDVLLDDPEEPESHAVDQRASPERTVGRSELRELAQELVRSVLDRLDERERAIIEQRHLAEQRRSLRALGSSLALSGERVRQLERRALRKLRDGFADASELTSAASCAAELSA